MGLTVAFFDVFDGKAQRVAVEAERGLRIVLREEGGVNADVHGHDPRSVRRRSLLDS